MGARNIFGAFVIALALFSFWPFVLGRWQQVGVLRQALAERQDLVDERQAALSNFAEELSRFQTRLSEDDMEKFAAMVPENKSTAELLSAIDTIANGTGMRLLEARLSEEQVRRRGATSTAATRMISMTLELEGQYASFKNFLSQLEQSVRLMDVQTLDVGSGDSVSEMTFSIQARAYFLQ